MVNESLLTAQQQISTAKSTLLQRKQQIATIEKAIKTAPPKTVLLQQTRLEKEQRKAAREITKKAIIKEKPKIALAEKEIEKIEKRATIAAAKLAEIAEFEAGRRFGLDTSDDPQAVFALEDKSEAFKEGWRAATDQVRAFEKRKEKLILAKELTGDIQTGLQVLNDIFEGKKPLQSLTDKQIVILEKAGVLSIDRPVAVSEAVFKDIREKALRGDVTAQELTQRIFPTKIRDLTFIERVKKFGPVTTVTEIISEKAEEVFKQKDIAKALALSKLKVPPAPPFEQVAATPFLGAELAKQAALAKKEVIREAITSPFLLPGVGFPLLVAKGAESFVTPGGKERIAKNAISLEDSGLSGNLAFVIPALEILLGTVGAGLTFRPLKAVDFNKISNKLAKNLARPTGKAAKVPITKAKVVTKEKPKLKITRKQATEGFKRLTRTEQIKILTQRFKDNVYLDQASFNKNINTARGFLKESGLSPAQITDRVEALKLRLRLRDVLLSKNQGLLTQQQADDAINLLKQKELLLREATQQALVSEAIVQVPVVSDVGVLAKLKAPTVVIQTPEAVIQSQLASIKIQLVSPTLTSLQKASLQQKQKLLQTQATLQLKKQEVKPISTTVILQAEPTAQITKTETVQLASQAQPTPTVKAQAVSLKAPKPTPPKPTIKPQKFQKPTKKVPVGIIFPIKPSAKKRLQQLSAPKKTIGYIAEAKDRGKWQKVKPKPFKTKDQAIAVGRFATDNTTSARHRVRKVSNVKDFAKFPVLPISSSAKFRDFKIVKGKRKPLENEWIEKRAARIDTRGEKEGLRLAKLIKQRFGPTKKIGLKVPPATFNKLKKVKL